ncbi:unnamed protein product [Heligmosomoides polygyrus]|uniref:TPT domain-containing protein n=1 Tax=Heligmosomoides polygyrus TaxID=6339 RepID=A0A183FTT3_HELPZ|nr:unnamed protein product [Heligmosomoides polygyrus]
MACFLSPTKIRSFFGFTIDSAVKISSSLKTMLRCVSSVKSSRSLLHLFSHTFYIWADRKCAAYHRYICINNVYRLTALTTSLNVTMVITLRKFLSLFVSFVAFGNPFNVLHFLGAVFVFIGSLMFSKVL